MFLYLYRQDSKSVVCNVIVVVEQDRSNSIANALELLQSYAKPLSWIFMCEGENFNSLGPNDTIMATSTWVNTGWGNGLMPDGTKPLPEPVLTYH